MLQDFQQFTASSLLTSMSHSHSASCVSLPVTLLPVTPLNVPRRKTQSATLHAGELPAVDAALSRPAFSRATSSPAPPPAFSWGSRWSSDDYAPSWATSRNAVDVDLPTGRKIRPLPRIPPAPKSAPPVPRRTVSQASLRPLPSLPELAVTPASPLTPAPFVPQSSAHLAPPPSTLPPPRPFASISLRLDTSPDALAPRVVAPPSPPPSPCPSIPQPPTPTTARRRRMSKLRRHLGESVELDLSPDSDKTSDGDQETSAFAQTIVAVKKLLDLDANDSDPSSDEDEDEYSLVFVLGQAQRVVPVKRYSRKWIRERGSKRWIEENYSDLLRDLRAL
ncbi:hypothetical protein B0H16DRAFT_1537458 [Mycena metata]|uniref:Uncharacterized protein n=1 Tax=Mycena metata TaxID=1033252 RepID=A0AAD7NE07_9AGAR|nr:hypothetical protein B0H16DRAFT_1537458 [Mycena metata]